HGKDAGRHGGEGDALPAALARTLECGAEGLHQLRFLVPFAIARAHRVDHAFERQLARGGDHRAAGRKWPALADQAIGFGLQLGTCRARDDSRHAAAVRQMAVRRVDDRVDRFFEQIAAHHRKSGAGRYFFLREDLRRRFGTLPPARRASERPMAIACLRLFTRLPERPLLSVPRLRLCIARLTLERALRPYLAIALLHSVHSTLAFALSPRTSSSIRCCWICCWMRGFTSASAGKRDWRTSSSWMMW